MLAQPAGVAPGEAAQSRGDGVGSGSSRRKPSRMVENRAEGFPVRDAFCFWWNSRAEALGINAKTFSLFGFGFDCHPQGWRRPIKEALHPCAFSACIVILAQWFSGRRRLGLSRPR